MDTLVLILAAILLPTWILGTMYLSFFPVSSTTDIASDPMASTAVSAQSTIESQELDDGGSTTAGEGGRSNLPLADANEQQSLQRKVGELEGLIAQKDAEIERLQQSPAVRPADESTVPDQETVKQLSQQVAQLTQQRDELNQQLQQSDADSNRSSTMDDEILQLTQQRNELQSRLTAAQSVSKEAAQLSRTVENLEARSRTQKNEIEALSKQLSASNTSNQSLRQKIETLQSEPSLINETSMAADQDVSTAQAERRNSPLEYRQWISSKGSKAQLAFVRWEGDAIVVVDEAGKNFRLTLDRLSPNDQAYVNKLR